MGVFISINLSETGRSSGRRRQVVHDVERVARPVRRLLKWGRGRRRQVVHDVERVARPV